MLVRVIGYTVDDGRENPTTYSMITALLDPAQASAVDLAVAHTRRWEIELTFDELNTPTWTPCCAAIEVARPSPQRTGYTCAAATRFAP